MLEVHLKVASGKHQGQAIPLTTSRFLIGREQDCQLRTNSDLVSRHHCVFTVDDYGVRLRDLGSTNGTLVNGERIREIILKPGDQVQIGKLAFEVQITERQVDERAAAPVAVDVAEALPETVERETAQLATDETQYEIPAVGAEARTAPGDTTILQSSQAGEAQLVYPPGYAIPPGPFAPPGYPYPPPNQYYPGAYAPPQGYPPSAYSPPGYPPPGYPPPGYPPPQYGQPVQQPPPGSSAVGTSVEAPPVRLPPPDQTGAQGESAPPPPVSQDDDSGTPPAMTPSQRAAEIIRQRSRKPT